MKKIIFVLSIIIVGSIFSYEVNTNSPYFNVKNVRSVDMVFLCNNSRDIDNVEVLFESNFREDETGFVRPISSMRYNFSPQPSGRRRVKINSGNVFELSPGLNKVTAYSISSDGIYSGTESAYINLSVDSLQVSLPAIHSLENKDIIDTRFSEEIRRTGSNNILLYLLKTSD